MGVCVGEKRRPWSCSVSWRSQPMFSVSFILSLLDIAGYLNQFVEIPIPGPMYQFIFDGTLEAMIGIRSEG